MLKKRVWLALCICCLTVCGCGASDKAEAPQVSIPKDQSTLGLTPDFSYAVEEQIPNIYINKVGYGIESNKIAYFKGKNLEEFFYIKNAATDEIVYKGTLRKTESAAEDEVKYYTGDFSEVDRTGKYVVYHDDLGYSFPFTIEQEPYDITRQTLQARIEQKKYETVSSCVWVMANLMLTKEIYPDSDVYGEFLKTKMEDFLVMQSRQGAFPKDYMTVQCVEEDDISLSATAEAAGVMAQYYYHYKATEPQLATRCLQASRKAFSYINTRRDNTATDTWYYAAAQLYRATGSYQYRNMILEYDSIAEESRRNSEKDYTLQADWAYLSTSFKTEYDRCNNIMDKYTERAQKISLNTSRGHFSVLESADTLSDEELLEDMVVLGILSYVLSGREYRGIQENYVHYFMGANSGAVNRVSEMKAPWAQEPTLEENVELASEFLFILENVY